MYFLLNYSISFFIHSKIKFAAPKYFEKNSQIRFLILIQRYGSIECFQKYTILEERRKIFEKLIKIEGDINDFKIVLLFSRTTIE